jgi:threonine synthase
LPATRCEACGGLVDVTYDLARVKLHASDDSLVRYRELLPCDVASRYPAISLSPTPSVHARSLGAKVGLEHLFLKNETVLPTGSTKDRIAYVGLPYLAAHGVRRFAMTSTGNSSTAFAWLLPRLPELELVIFTPEEFLPRVRHPRSERISHFALRGGSYDDSMAALRRYEASAGLRAEGGFFNPGRREGLKLAFFEAVDQLGTSFEWYVQAVSSAMGVYGCFKGAKELMALGRLDRLPKLLCVQQASCAPMATAFEKGLDRLDPSDVVLRPRGIASAILMGDPTSAYPYVASIVRESRGDIMAVDEQEIRDAQRALYEYEGLSACFSASAAIAGVLRAAKRGEFSRNARILVNVTGAERSSRERESGRPSEPDKIVWLERAGDAWLRRTP